MIGMDTFEKRKNSVQICCPSTLLREDINILLCTNFFLFLSKRFLCCIQTPKKQKSDTYEDVSLYRFEKVVLGLFRNGGIQNQIQQKRIEWTYLKFSYAGLDVLSPDTTVVCQKDVGTVGRNVDASQKEFCGLIDTTARDGNNLNTLETLRSYYGVFANNSRYRK